MTKDKCCEKCQQFCLSCKIPCVVGCSYPDCPCHQESWRDLEIAPPQNLQDNISSHQDTKQGWEEEFDMFMNIELLQFASEEELPRATRWKEKVKMFISTLLKSETERVRGEALIEVLAKVESATTAKEARHIIKDLLTPPQER